MQAAEIRAQLITHQWSENAWPDIIDIAADIGLVTKSLIEHEKLVSCEAILDFLSRSSSAQGDELYRLVTTLMISCEQFAAADAPERRALLRLLDENIVLGFRGLEVPTTKSWAGLILYEDVVVSEVRAAPDSQAWNVAAKDLQDLTVAISPLLDANISARETVLHILRNDFSGASTPLLLVMEHYSEVLHSATPSRGRERRDYTPNALNLASLEALAAIRREFGSAVSEASDLEEVDFRSVVEKNSWAERVAGLHLAAPITTSEYTCCYSQPVRMSGREVIVINKLHSGPFRAMLRACSALPLGRERNEFLAELRTRIRGMYEDAEPYEVRAEFDFNINCHPDITDGVINYTGTSIPGVKEITLADLMLSETDHGGLKLSSILNPRHPIVPLTFGLMAPAFQPPILYVLLSLGARDPFVYKPFDPFSWDSEKMDAKVLKYPRLRFGSCVLRRKGWAIHHSILPKRNGDESEGELFTQVIRWKRQLALPNEVFVRAKTFEECMRPQNSGKQKARILHKPQYLNFGNYLLVDSFLSLCGDCESYMYIEEALPGKDDWNSFPARRAFEIVVDTRSGPPRVPCEEAAVMS